MKLPFYFYKTNLIFGICILFDLLSTIFQGICEMFFIETFKQLLKETSHYVLMIIILAKISIEIIQSIMMNLIKTEEEIVIRSDYFLELKN